jgi:ABC-type sugar transport system substrate-binding protein
MLYLTGNVSLAIETSEPEVIVKKRSVLLLCIVLLSVALLLPACGTAADNKAQEPARIGDGDDSVNTVALFMPDMKDASLRNLSDAVIEYATLADIEITVHDAEADADKQISQIKTVVAEGVDSIILCPVSSADLDEGLSAAADAVIPVIVLRENVADAKNTAAFVGPDFTDGGEQTMAQAMRDLPGGGKIAEIRGPEKHAATKAISDGYAIALDGEDKKYPIAETGSGNWSAEESLKLVNDWFAAETELSAIVCNNDSMATGAAEAVRLAGKTGEINIYGLGAQDNILKAIQAGTVNATVAIDFDTEAKTAVELAAKAIAREEFERNCLIPMTLITADNVSSFMN